MKRSLAIFMISVFFLIVFLPIVMPMAKVSAQSSGYSITQVDHEVEVMYSGQVVVRDTIHVSGQVTDGFMIGLPSKYSVDVLKAVAFDDNNSYPVTLGVQLSDQIYGTQVSFNGKTPSVFTVAFILSNNVISYTPQNSAYILDFPAYPSLTQNVATCNVTLNLPSTPAGLTITKSDGTVQTNNYGTQNLAAYTNSVALASFQLSIGTLQLTSIDQLDRTIIMDATGKVFASDKYHLINVSPATMTTFIVGIPTTSSNVKIVDAFGRTLVTEVAGTITYGSTDVTHDAELVNATLVTFLGTGQSTIITAEYTLPSATLQGSQYSLGNFYLYPDFFYYVENATFIFVPPEGATIVNPKISALDPSTTLTRNSFQDTLKTTRNGISYLDYNIPQSLIVQFSYDYNPVWVSFRPTIWLSFIAVIGCVGAVVFRRQNSNAKATTKPKSEKFTTQKSKQAANQQTKGVESIDAQKITAEHIKEFIEAYEEKKQLNTELKSLDAKAQKGKIPRRQYKVQRQAIETRLETLDRNTDKLKAVFRNSGTFYTDIAKQLDSAEADLAEADESINTLESQQNTGEVSMETYKETIGDYQKQRDKAESTINGILLRLREKTR